MTWMMRMGLSTIGLIFAQAWYIDPTSIMCGITGVYHVEPRTPASAALVERMADTIVHRGPDDGTVHVDGPVGLGFRRLAIIDVAGGRQPIFSEDRSKAIIFNGEIYNFRPLTQRLKELGHRFQTHSDTEAILHAYEEYGQDCVRHLRGMFAFAIWDATRRELFLARDRVGIKPLYYRWDGSTFTFGSEIKALLADPAVPRKIDPLALDEYLTYLYVPAPRTIFQGIRKLHAGHTLTVGPRGPSEQREYWDLRFTPVNGMGEEEAARQLLDKLRESVQVHLESEVPLGAFLSGGIDSSAVVGIMAGLMDRPVNTASIGFRDQTFDELPYARAMAQRFKASPYEKIVDASAARILDKLAWHYDEPFADSSQVPTYYVSQVARERVTVCLSGDGGDENFAGYRRYKFEVWENRLRSLLPGALRRPVFSALGAVYPKLDWLPRVFRAKTTFQNLALDPERGYFHTMSWLSRAKKAALYGTSLRREVADYDSFAIMESYFNRTEGWDPLSRVQYVDIKTFLVDDILTKVDRASMAHSLEVRVPLLDHEVMEFAATLPSSFKLRGSTQKYVLKRALKDLLPEETMNRTKMGFSVPLARWLRGELRPVFEERMFAADAFVNEIFEPAPIRAWWDRHQSGASDFSPLLWSLLMLESWGRRFLRG